MSDLTVVIPTSPVPCHPSTEVIEKVLESVVRQLPDARIMILCDGVRPELEHRREAYNEYILRLLKKMDEIDNEVDFNVFQKHKHQAGLLKSMINDIKTPNFLFCEHDCVLDDKSIGWELIDLMLESRTANLVRLYWHKEIHPEHVYLMGERLGPFVKTVQYSGWPHVARVDFYKRVLDDIFSENSKRMLETGLYGPALLSWDDYRMWVYAPEPDAIRFHHLNARVDKDGKKDFGDW